MPDVIVNVANNIWDTEQPVLNSFYVSTSGNDVTGDGSELSPWRTPEFGARQLTSSVPVLTVSAGTYVIDETNLPASDNTVSRYQAIVSPTTGLDGTSSAPLTIRSAGDGLVLFDSGASPNYPAVGTNTNDYVKIEGISVDGEAIMWSTVGSEIIDCDLYGSGGDGDNFGCVVRVEFATDCAIKNSLLHDNAVGITQDNSPLLIEYDTTNLLIENCGVYNSVASGLRFKDNPHNITIRNCYIYDNALAGVQATNQDTGDEIYIYNNLFRNNNTANSSGFGAIRMLVIAYDWSIYNNTFVDNNVCDIRVNYDSTYDIKLWNNIHYNTSGGFYRFGFSSSGATIAATITYSDNNDFFGSANFQEMATTWGTLSAYSVANTLDIASTTNDPSFINAAGIEPADFKRTSYPADGRGGAYELVKGCYIDGTEQIGASI